QFLGVTSGIWPSGCGTTTINCGPSPTPQNDCYGLDLLASQTDTVAVDAHQVIDTPLQIAIPSEVEITQGLATLQGLAMLSLSGPQETAISCTYRNAENTGA